MARPDRATAARIARAAARVNQRAPEPTRETIGDRLANVPDPDVRDFYRDRLAEVCDPATDPVRAALAALWLHRTLWADPPMVDANMADLLALTEPYMPWPTGENSPP